MEKLIIFNIKDDVFGVEVRIVIGPSWEANKYFKRKYPGAKDGNYIPKTYTGMSWRQIEEHDKLHYRYYYIWAEKFNWKISHQQTLSHEIYHTVTKILLDRNLKHTEDNDDIFAYYFDFMLGRIWTRLNKSRKKVKRKIKKKK